MRERVGASHKTASGTGKDRDCLKLRGDRKKFLCRAEGAR